MTATFLRRVIRIRAEDSPNVKRGLLQRAKGQKPDGKEVLPGVLGWEEYLYRRRVWDQVRQCVGLDAEFWKGADLLLYPPDWRRRAAERFAELKGRPRRALGVGIDCGEGKANTAFSACDELGVIEVVGKQTPDTNVIPGEAIAFWQRHGAKPEQVCLDLGGGGKQAADRLRAMGYAVQTVAFGGAPSLPIRRGVQAVSDRREVAEERSVYVNLRAEMYHRLSLRLDPGNPDHPEGWGVPGDLEGPVCAELQRQMAPLPKLIDERGRYWMLPKSKKDAAGKTKTLMDLLGASPDELDAVVLALHAVEAGDARQEIGAW